MHRYFTMIFICIIPFISFASEKDNELIIRISSPNPINTSTLNGTLFSAYSTDKTLLFSAGFPHTWNTYYANVPGQLHAFVRTNNEQKKISTITQPNYKIHSSYVVNTVNGLFLNDTANKLQYSVELDQSGQYTLIKPSNTFQPEPFKHNDYQYSDSDGVVTACEVNNLNHCDTIKINKDTWVFAYAGNKTNSVAITNWGDVLFHTQNGWCRGEKIKNKFVCNKKDLGLLDTYRGMQMYSSIQTDEGTFLGEWPTGRLWKLGDGELVPTSDGPYNEDTYNNLELQSLGLFCGDLYAGYWPFGEVWKKSWGESKWIKVYQLFSHPNLNLVGNIPYLDLLIQMNDSTYSSKAFFGQRATSMAIYQNSLFISSGNLNSWSSFVPDPSFLSSEQINEYGTLHYISNPNCITTQVEDTVNLVVKLSSDKLVIYNNGMKIAETNLENFNLSDIATINKSTGVFGPLSDHEMVINVTEAIQH